MDRGQDANRSGAVLSSRPRSQGNETSEAPGIRTNTPCVASGPPATSSNSGTPPPIPSKPAVLSSVDDLGTTSGRDSGSHNYSCAASARVRKGSLSDESQDYGLPASRPEVRRNGDGSAGLIPSSRISALEFHDGPLHPVGIPGGRQRTGDNAPDLLDSAVDDKVSWRPLLR